MDNQIPIDIPQVALNPTMPWSTWAEPTSISQPIDDIKVGLSDSGAIALMDHEERVLADFSDHGLQELAWHMAFPKEFVSKLNPDVKIDVINDRIRAYPSKEMQFVGTGDSITNVIPGWRPLADHRQLAQHVFNIVSEVDGEATVESAILGNDGMVIKILGRRQESITPAVGDVLQIGIEFTYRHGSLAKLALYLKRLCCLNGMTSNTQAFQWSQKTASSVAHQLGWIQVAINECFNAYEAIVSKSRVMAATPVVGDPHEALKERIKAMGINRRYHAAIIEAFDQEPGGSEWHMLNAITRYATHGAEAASRSDFQGRAGNWVHDFDQVNARLPRRVAEKVGAHIIDENN